MRDPGACTVRERTAEIGIRIALGAVPRQVRALVFRQAAVVVGARILIGLAGSFALGRGLAVIAFGVSATEPRILLLASLVLVVAAIGAAWSPARRAARLAPGSAIQTGA